MNRRSRSTALARLGFTLFAAFLLTTGSGCTSAILSGYALSFGAGWLLGQSSITTTTECYLNGERIDCADVP